MATGRLKRQVRITIESAQAARTMISSESVPAISQAPYSSIGKLHPRRDSHSSPFTVLTRPSPSAYTLALPRRMRCSPTVHVDSDRLKPFFQRAVWGPPAPGPVSDQEPEGEHEVELLLNRRAGGCAAHRARRHALPAHVRRRRVAAGGGAGSLPRQGGGVRRCGPPSPCGSSGPSTPPLCRRRQ